MSRITLIQGLKPYLIVAPHGGGPTDLRTALIAEIIANYTDAFAVINTGWIRPWKGQGEGSAKNIPTKPDIANGIANLNDIRQARKNPAKQEFLKPLDNYKNFILTKYKQVYIFLIHGMDDMIRNYNGIDIVIGYGAGDPPRHSCPLTFKDRFISCLAMEQFKPAQGKSKGRLSAWGSNNLNQLYANENRVTSVQVEIGLTIRQDDQIAKTTALRLSHAISNMMNRVHVPFMRKIPER